MGTTPDKTVVVGDTMEDISMGLNAKVGLTIGVLTGVGSHSELVQADHIVSSVSEILHHLVAKQEKNNNNGSIGNNKINPKSVHPAASNARLFSTLSHNKLNQLSIHRYYSTDSPRSPLLKLKYDYVIVGAGSAGSVLANRLSEDGKSSVLLIEAGPKDTSWKIRMPAALMYNLCDDKYNWYYHTEPEPGMNSRIMYQPRGRVLGGSSSLNAMVYVRGHAGDYDRWEKEGAAGWAYSNCLPYFRKSQTHELGPNEYRGGEGPLHVSRGKTNHPLHRAFIEAGKQAGYPFTDDMNGYQQEGVGWMDMTVHNGQRWSTSNAYLSPAIPRKNLHIITKTMVSRVLFSDHRAVGVDFEHGGLQQTVEAEKEVILSGGSINSPQLLQMSGVGNGDLLKSLDIPVVHHLPGVGMNLQDHLEIYVQQACTQPITLYSAQWKYPHNMIRIGLEWFLLHTGYGATSHLESGGFIRSRAGLSQPNIQYHFLPSTVNDHGRKIGHCHAYQVHVGPMKPTSRGSVTILSKDPRKHPKIVFNYLSTPEDLEEFRDGIKLTREIFAQKAFDEFRGEEIAPGKEVTSDKQLDAFARQMADSAYHPSCSCKMGSPNDPMAVVDPSCRVIGLDGLRVVDASIMPSVVSGNLNGPTVMIAEKAADIIRGRQPLPTSDAPVWQPHDPNKQR
uniref:Choline dehydrogenase n=1 Tax=Arion vulgaris TaxID=1028688 RepID=A0A0B7BBK3_9EUPU